MFFKVGVECRILYCLVCCFLFNVGFNRFSSVGEERESWITGIIVVSV